MTNQTLILALLIGATLALVLGMAGRRFKHPSIASTLAFSLATVLSLPVMLGYWQDAQRLISPREAIEWIPLGLLGLAITTSIAVVDHPRSKLWIGFGLIIAILLVLRLMYGSIYLRTVNLFSFSTLMIVGWGIAVGLAWSFQHVSHESSRKLDGVLQLIGLLAVSVNLGMSGSFTYAAVGFLCVSIALSSWLAGRTLPTLVATSSLLILGLGPTFAETQWLVASLLGVMVLLFAGLPRLQIGRLRWGVMLLATLCLTVGSVLSIVKLREDISGQSKEATGYEAYR